MTQVLPKIPAAKVLAEVRRFYLALFLRHGDDVDLTTLDWFNRITVALFEEMSHGQSMDWCYSKGTDFVRKCWPTTETWNELRTRNGCRTAILRLRRAMFIWHDHQLAPETRIPLASMLHARATDFFVYILAGYPHLASLSQFIPKIRSQSLTPELFNRRYPADKFPITRFAALAEAKRQSEIVRELKEKQFIHEERIRRARELRAERLRRKQSRIQKERWEKQKEANRRFDEALSAFPLPKMRKCAGCANRIDPAEYANRPDALCQECWGHDLPFRTPRLIRQVFRYDRFQSDDGDDNREPWPLADDWCVSLSLRPRWVKGVNNV